MTSSLLPYLLLSGLIGFHCEIITVDKVSVKAGGSISIPCLYELRYRDKVKYLCKGSSWGKCTYAVKTDQPDSTRKFSISDDTNRGIFTVTINDVTYDDTDDTWYWCAVDLLISDDKKQFELSVTSDESSLYVDQQEVAAFERGSVTVSCHSENLNEKGWCQLGSTCVTDRSGSIDGAAVTISEAGPDVFNVTMSGLTTENSGWYWCTRGGFQMPVHLTVHEFISSTTKTTIKTTTACVESNTSAPTNSTGNQLSEDSVQDEHKSFTKIIILITILIALLLLVAGVLFGWRIKTRKTIPEVSDSPESPQTGSDLDVQYATIYHNRSLAAQTKDHAPEDSVTYSNIVMKDRVQQATEPADV
ncbi:CMRF35-like molecule 1 isoform X1 [Xyrichtys novacula]|nr:CMRF35-like molecule 1 isoform X1 [Xyrichtys novacula]